MQATHEPRRAARAALTLVLAIAAALLCAPGALAISAPIHISGTDGEGVLIRSGPATSYTAVGWMPEGASPDYNCFVWGQDIEGTPIWFSVNYNGKSGYYASFYDDSSYHSNEELTAKYGVPLCGAAASPGPSPPPAGGPAAGNPPPASSTPPPSTGLTPAAVYYSPYGAGSHPVGDGLTISFNLDEWESGCGSRNPKPVRPYEVALGVLEGTPVETLAGWSKGRIGVISFLANAPRQFLEQIDYVLLIDPGSFGEMSCDRERHAGEVFANWLRVNTGAHLVVISGSHVTQLENSAGIQHSYFDAIRSSPGNLSPRVLTCNYDITHENAFSAAKYWIQHQIGSTKSSCPWLSLGGTTYKPTAGRHPNG